jgi:hypothetical protein
MSIGCEPFEPYAVAATPPGLRSRCRSVLEWMDDTARGFAKVCIALRNSPLGAPGGRRRVPDASWTGGAVGLANARGHELMTPPKSSAPNTNRPPLGLVLRAIAVIFLLLSYPFILVVAHNYPEVSLSPRAIFWQMLVRANYPQWMGVAFIVVYVPTFTVLLANKWKIHFIVVATSLSAVAYPGFMYILANVYPFTRFSRHFLCASEPQICLPAFFCGCLMADAIGIAGLISIFIFRMMGRKVFPSYRERIRQHAMRRDQGPST